MPDANQDRSIGPALLGWLEAPRHGERVGRFVHLAGWVFAREGQVLSLTAAVGRARHAVPHGLPRPDVAEAYGNAAGARYSGFDTYLPVEPGVAGTRLTVWAALPNGRRVPCFARCVIGTPKPDQPWWRALADKVGLGSPVGPATADALGPAGPPAASAADLLRAGLDNFLATNELLDLTPSGPPLVSVVVVLLNRAPLTFGCLTALLAASPPWVELVMVDNGSTDSTSRLLQRVRGATIVRNERNLGFAAAVNQGARAGSGQYLLLLNNDAQLLPGSLEAALRRLETRSDAGAVGGRLVWPDGRLQEAGSVVFDDGTCRGYGRGARALDGEYMFARDVDFCSGAFLLTARQTFMESGGFDEVFSPAYYEDVDYCVRLRGAGRLILYEPRAAAIHFEFGSATSVPEALEAQATGRKRFVEKHRDWLRRQMAPGSILQARSRRGEGLRVVVFDDRVPHPELGSGLGRSAALLRALVELGHFVTFYPLGVTEEEWGRVYHVLPDTVEVMLGRGAGGVGDFVRERRGYYDCTIVSRAPNMRLLQAALRAQGAWPPSKALIYDAEAVAACRELARRRVAGEPVQATEAARLLSEELQLGASAGLVFSVSARERERFVEAGIEDVRVLSYPIEPTPTRAPFDERLGLLFAGGFSAPSPSADSVTWFAAQVLPRLRAAAGADLRFCVAGATPPPEVARLTGQGVDILGCVEDLTALYDRSRVFVAPTRFAAGIPLKVLDAAAHGLPVVCTSLLADQLGWRDGEQLLVADDPATFADCCLALHHDAALWHRLRRAALDRIALDCSPEAFRDTLRQALTSLITSRAPR